MDIFDAFAHLRVVFRRENLEPPTAIYLGSREEGLKFLSSIRQSSHYVGMVSHPSNGIAVEYADGSVYMEVSIMDIKVRWPANLIATSDGGWSYV